MALAAPSATAQETLPPDAVDHSANMKHLVNVPFPAAVGGAGTVGTDMAFTNDHAIVGNYNGFTIFNVKKPSQPKVVSSVRCPGAQNDVTVHGDLLFLSVDRRMADDKCGSPASTDPAKYWEGVRIFDISDKANPQYVKSVETKCGSHTHTLVPGKSKSSVYLYVSSYGPSDSLANCKPPHDLISVIKVPVADPTAAKVVNEPVMFPDGGHPGHNPPNINTQGGYPTQGCHDITVYPSKNIAAGACMGDGVLWNISDREQPKEIDRVTDAENFAFWHSATFSNDASKIVFTDELGGGGAATCNEDVDPEHGANGIYTVSGSGDSRQLNFASYYKIPRVQDDSENCVAHNGNLIPVPGKDIMVQSWYMGGTYVWDFTDAANPKEIGFFERGPASNPAEGGGTWSSYYYNGHIYSSDIGKGLDVFRIDDAQTDPAKSVRTRDLNAQTQYTYPG